jgi:hypothetical protein
MVTATDATAGCATTATVAITVNPLPVISSVTATPTSVCTNGSVSLTAASSNVVAGTVAIGTQSSTSITGGPYRSGAASDMKVQYLFTAAELQAANLHAGNITSIAFNVTSVGDASLPSFTIKMGNTSASALSSTFDASSLTTVFSPVSYTTTSGENTHTFTTPFVWNGTSNVIVQVCHGVSSGVSSSVVSLATATNTVTYSTATSACASATTGTLASARPVITFGGPVGTDLTGTLTWTWNPGNLSGSGVTATAQGTPGTQTFTVSATNPTTGCIKTATVDVVVGATLNLSAASVPASVCSGSNATLTATASGGGAPYSYSWKDANNTVLGTTVSISVSPTVTSVYTVTVTDNCGNSTSQNVTVTAIALPAVSINPAGSTNVCTSSQLLTGSTDAASPSYQWMVNATNIGSATSASYTAVAGGAFTLRVTDGVTGCINTSAASTLNFQLSPSAITMTPASATICLGATQSLAAAATVPTSLLTENFNTGAPLWTVTSLSATSAGVPITNVNWYNQAAGYTDASGSVTFSNFSVDGTPFAYANSDAGGSGSKTRTALTSPAFNTVGFTTATLTFKNLFRYWSTGDSLVAVQYTVDGTTWVNMKTYTSDQGTTTNSAQVATNESIALPAGALNQPTVRIRFNYVSTWGYVWIIDNVSLTGTAPAVQYAWSSAVGSGLSAGQQAASVANNNISVTPSVEGIYTLQVTASLSGSSCTTTNSMSLTVVRPSVVPTLINASASGSQCAGTNIILTQTGGSLGQGAYWQWYADAAFAQPVGGQLSSANAQITVTPTVTTTYYLRAEAGTAPCAILSGTASTTITVHTPTVAGTASSSQAICISAIPTALTLLGSNGSIQWQSSSDALFTSTTNLGTTATQSIAALGQTTYYRAIVNNGGCNALSSNTVTITVALYPAAFTLSGSGSYCNGVGRSITLSGSEIGISYQLKDNATNSNVGAPVAGTGSGLSFGTHGAGNYSVVGTNSTGCPTAQTGSAAIIDLGQFSAQISAQNNILCQSGSFTTIMISNGPANGSVSVTTNGVNAQTYSLDGTGSASFQTGTLTANSTYTITSVSNGTCATTTSISTTVYVGSLLANPNPSPTVCAGTSVTGQNFTGNFPNGTQYTWTASNGIAIGLPANSGTGTSLPVFTALNAGLTSISSDIMVRPILNIEGCSIATMAYKITVNPLPTVNGVGNQVVCAGSNTSAISFSGNFGGTVYSWTNSNTSIGLIAAGTGAIPAFVGTNNTGSTAITGTINVTPYYNSCAGVPASFTIQVKKSVISLSYQGSPYCQGGYAVPQQTGTAGGVYGATPVGLNISSVTGQVNLSLSTPGTYSISYTVSGSAAGCGGSAATSITILPKATVNTVGNPALCANNATATINFTGSALLYSWTNSNTAIGLAASGNGNISSFTALNSTAATISAQINVYPIGNGSSTCPGQPMSFHYTVYPRPTVNAVDPSVLNALCRGALTSPVTFTSGTPASTYTWTNSNNTIGLTPTSGTGGLPAFVAANPNVVTSGITNLSTINVRATANKCQGPVYSFVLTVGDCATQPGDTGGDANTSRTSMASQVVVGPNPTQNRVTVTYKGKDSGPFTVQLVSQFGQVIAKPVSFSGNSYTLDLTGLTPGVYVLQFVNPRTKETVQKQVIKL